MQIGIIMWCLKDHKDLCIYILPDQKKTFGKSLSDVKLEGDTTISRLHAIISVELTRESETEYKCIISDISKYGTFVIRDKKKRKLTDEKFTLKADDIVQFGLKQTTFVVSHHSYVIARSNLDKDDLATLNTIVHRLRGRLSETWEDSCTHLTVTKSVLFTTKLACALASSKPIVTIAYWEALDIAIKESKELPRIDDFLPTVKEEWLNVCSKLFLPNEKRRTLFKSLSFVHFCAKQYFAYTSLITAAGGKSCVYPTKRPLTPRDLTAKNAIIIQHPGNDSSQFSQVITADYPIIYRKLQAVKRRMISDTEIPLAILYCTTDMYCNPKFDFATFIKSKTQSSSFSDFMIVNDTQDADKTDKKQIKRKLIPETCDSQNNENVLKKSCFSHKSEQKNIYSASDIATINLQNADKREMKCKIISETSDSQYNETIPKKANFSNKNEQKNVSDTIKSEIAAKIQNHENIHKNIYFSNKSEQENVSGSSKINIMNNLSFEKFDKQPQIIPETCLSLGKNTSNVFFGKCNNNQTQIIYETCKSNEKIVVSDTAKQNINLQEKEVFEKNNLIFEKYNSDLEDSNSIVEEDNLIYNNHKSGNESWESSKNLKRPRIISIEKANDSKIYVQAKEKNILGKDCSRVEKLQNSSKEEKLDLICNWERNQEDKNANENTLERKDEIKKEHQETRDDWYGYRNRKFVDKIMRKDIPCGKRFTKTPVMIPKRILRANDFVL